MVQCLKTGHGRDKGDNVVSGLDPMGIFLSSLLSLQQNINKWSSHRPSYEEKHFPTGWELLKTDLSIVLYKALKA